MRPDFNQMLSIVIDDLYIKTDTNIDRQSLIRGLQKYGGIKTIIQELTQQIDELNQQISELQTKKGFG